MTTFLKPIHDNIIGYKFFNDFEHYRSNDIEKWIPILKSIGASWLLIQSPLDRAVPEYFIKSCIQNSIEPIIQFHGKPGQSINLRDLQLLVKNYAKWDVHYIVFHQCPNSRTSWTTVEWIQDDLADFFIDRYIPIASLAIKEGINPIFPPLQPGGDYWDLVFLQACLRNLIQKKQTEILEKFLLGAFAYTFGHNFDWGRGGPTRWQGVKPYFCPPDQQDHLGINIGQWYQSIIKAELGNNTPIFLLGVGDITPGQNRPILDEEFSLQYTTRNFELFNLFYKDGINQLSSDQFEGIYTAIFNLFPETQTYPFSDSTWISSDGQQFPIIHRIQEWISQQTYYLNESGINSINIHPETSGQTSVQPVQDKLIQNYLLMPLYTWGVADWELDSVRKFILKEHPTLGYSVEEAKLASTVTIFEPKPGMMDSVSSLLTDAGCKINILNLNGMRIAPSFNKNDLVIQEENKLC
jgi:hypothetical protein